MTFRAKPIDRDRPRWGEHGRQGLLVSVLFGLVTLAGVLILVGAVGLTWWNDRFGTVAVVEGIPVTRSDLRERIAIEGWRIEETERRLRDELNAGRLTSAEFEQQVSALQQRRQQVPALAYERLIDATLQAKLAAEAGVGVTEEEIDRRLTEEATSKERRHVWEIVVRPEVDPGQSEPSAAQRAAAREEAERALADLRAGKPWEEVARTVSDAPSRATGGDLGWVVADETIDSPFEKAVFGVPVDTPTEIVEGEDGAFRIGRVTEIVPAAVDPTFTQRILDAGISLEAYRRVVRADLIQEKLEAKVVADVVDRPTPQRRVSQIYIPAASGEGDEVKVRHILYAPNDDPQAAQSLPADDPAWKTAEDEARRAYEKLAALRDQPAELEKTFEELAASDSDDLGTASNGGELDWITRDVLDEAFGTAVFAAGLKEGQLLEPVKSQFGWHLVQFIGRRPTAQVRIEGAHVRASAPGADFAAIARELSEGPEAAEGGEIGWVARGQLASELEAAIFGTPVGGVSAVVEVPGDGWYLFKVWEEQVRKPDEAQAEKLRQTAFSNWYAEKKAAAKIERSDRPFEGIV
ncbi:MAG TPA: peptidylprolyl isomerase [Candidatus Limnocylindrales bacterium]|jgi:parvulin-like peptidyl-prolyl isomerase|nr:peptidylprolyl isomerase [Candidatus Limnocylindrales bacterium]